MDQAKLAELLKDVRVQLLIVGDHAEKFSLGVTLNPDDRKQAAIRLRVAGKVQDHFPPHILLEGEYVTLLVDKTFEQPSSCADISDHVSYPPA